MNYQPPRALGLLVGATFTLWALSIAALLINFASASDFEFSAVLAITGAVAAAALASLFGYWTYALATMNYALDRNGLVIQWGVTRQVVPLGDIERLVPGTSVGIPSVKGVSWLGYHIGRATIERIGDVLFYTTHQNAEQVLYVMTSERNYAISVEDPAGFARQVQIHVGIIKRCGEGSVLRGVIAVAATGGVATKGRVAGVMKRWGSRDLLAGVVAPTVCL